ncbi:HPP family protein [Euzebyella marina]|uniref:HPP family protein n=1 Tax=Euzebyella marina TaxID=1761453 RepID=A0A3G2L5J0_9FLAO|nr:MULTISPECIES: HPP family protein [Bacteroidota]AYN67503.1 HPP family protein [Euzebyella marina]MBC7000495.1 HPP family protein [Cytophaga sp. FL35]
MKNVFNRSYRIGRYIVYRETLLEPKELFWSFVGSFCGIGLIGFVQSQYLSHGDNVLLIGSFGATGVLIYGAIHSPLAQPRNLMGGHIFSAIVGVSVALLLGDILWLAAALSVAISILVMQISKTLHPPGGATALIAVIGSEKITSLGYWYVLFPVLSGVSIMFVVALFFNNLTPNRTYPSKGRFLKTLHWAIRPAKTKLQRIKGNSSGEKI